MSSQLSLKDVKGELKKYGAKISGRKKELIERLEFYQRNADDCASATQPEYQMCVPDYTLFKDLHKGMLNEVPEVTLERILCYLSLFHKKFEEKCKDLYEERYIRYIRFFQDGDNSYITASVWAEMRKSVSYRADIALQSTGVIVESQCECAVGQGPTAHCKHVVSILYGLMQFKKNNGVIITEQTCTQTLQTFHKAKPYVCSPMQFSTLRKLRDMDNIDYDPRPAHLRGLKGKLDRVKNLILNQQSVRPMAPMPIMQLFPAANPVALTLDYDYCEAYDTDTFLKKRKITSMQASEIQELESLTRDQRASKRWKYEHEVRITSSNFGKICRATRADMDKMARTMVLNKDFTSAPTTYGKKYEQVAIETYAASADVSIRKCGLFIDPTAPFLAASPDGIIDKHSGMTLIEVKCPYSARDQKIDEQTVDYLIKEEGELTLKKSHSYFYQVQGQLMCTGASTCHFIVFSQRDMKVIEINRDDRFIEEMRVKLVNFFDNHFKQAVIDRHYYRDYKKYCFCVNCTGHC